MSAKLIDIAAIVPVSEVNGPGKRAVIWVQGCPKRCASCWNPEYLVFGSKWHVSPTELFESIQDKTENFSLIEGITFSGGEPFAQSEVLAQAASLFKEKSLTLMCYSGYTLQEIQAKGTPYTDLLEALDILVDGEFKKDQSCNRLWHSSLNQKVHFLTDRYKSYQALINKDIREFEVVLSPNEIRMTGFPELDLLRNLK